MPTSSQPHPARDSPEGRVVGSPFSAVLLAFTGGGLDSFTYLNHGQVFAGAMTGNSVLLAIAVLSRDRQKILFHLLPLVGFLAGFGAAHLLESKLNRHAVTTALAGEFLVLLAASWLPGHFPDTIFVAVISLVAAFQVGSFRSVDAYAYNSTFLSGNLRTITDGLRDLLHPEHREAGWRKFRDLSLIVAGFLTGAGVGALASPRLLNRTLWVLDVPLLVVLGLALWAT